MSGTLTWARLSFRLQRLEIIILAAAVAVASGLMAWFAFQLDGLSAAYPDCDFFDPVRACQAAGRRFSEVFGSAELIIRNTWVAGFAIGLVLGVPLVAREIEHGTARLAWTVSRSRARWLIRRVAFGVLMAVLLSALLAVTTELLATAMLPEIDMSRDFNLHGNRGPLIVGRAVMGLGAGVLVGALLGRQLPALLVGLIVVGGLYWASWIGFPLWYRGEAEVRSINEWLGGPLWIESGIELTSGERVTLVDFYSAGLGEFWGEDGNLYASQADAEAGRNPIGREYVLIIPGERYNEIVARETAVFTGAGLILLGAAAGVTGRRRPS